MIDDSLLRQCVHCGLCLEACPTYLQLGTEMDSPRGRIHLVTALAEGSLPASAEVVRHLDLCLGCRACESACPSGVQYGQILEGAREHLEQQIERPRMDRWRRALVLAVFPRPTRLRALVSVVRSLQTLRLWSLVERIIPAARLFPRLGSEKPVRSSSAGKGERGRVGFLTGCVASVVQPQVNGAAARVLERCEVSVDVPSEQGCCGALHLHAGDLDEARALARANIDAFAHVLDELDAIVVTAAGCGAAMRDYGTLLRDDDGYSEAAARFSARVRDITEYADEILPSELEADRPVRVTYHDACHLAHAQNVREQPRRLLRRLRGATLVELDEAEVCCGSAGSYNLTEPAMAGALARRKVDNVERAEVDCLSVANPGCALQIRAELRRRGKATRVAHPIELIDEALRSNG